MRSVLSMVEDLLSPDSPPPSPPGAKNSASTQGERGEKGENPRRCWSGDGANAGEPGAKKGENRANTADDSPDPGANSPFFAPHSPDENRAESRAVADFSPFSPNSPSTQGEKFAPEAGEPANRRCWLIIGEDAVVSVSGPGEMTLEEIQARYPGAEIEEEGATDRIVRVQESTPC